MSVDYRLAPEHPFPAAVDDAVAAYRWLLDQGTAPERVILSGDSAGGGLVLALLVAVREAGLPLPAGAIPISPWADLTCTNESWTRNAGKDLLLEIDSLSAIAGMYSHDADPTGPLLSPQNADYGGLPPLYIQAAGHEALLDDVLAVTSAAARAGVNVRLDVFGGMQHVFQYCAGTMPEADDAIERMAEWITSTVGVQP